MILADTSVWIDHFRTFNAEFYEHLNQGNILMHPFVAAELALGLLARRAATVAFLDDLPEARVARLDEVRHLIEAQSLYGRGIGLTDAHLVASTLITQDCVLSTRDKRLRAVAKALGIHADV